MGWACHAGHKARRGSTVLKDVQIKINTSYSVNKETVNTVIYLGYVNVCRKPSNDS